MSSHGRSGGPGRSGSRRVPRRGQATVEFGLLIGGFMVWLLLAWYFAWTLLLNIGLQSTLGWVGEDLVNNASYAGSAALVSEASQNGLELNPTSDTLTITITDASTGDSTDYSWDNTPVITYGDIISVYILKPITFDGSLDLVPDLSGTWIGVAQRDSP